jgi:peptidoglycan/LPS O-acetylase OafA/YrhL
MLFYLLAPVLIWTGLRFKRWQSIVLPSVVVWPLGLYVLGKCSESFIWPVRFAPLRVPEFCLGVAAAVCFSRFKVSYRWNWFCICAGLFLIGAAVGCDDLVPYCVARGPLTAPGAALLIYGLAAGQGFLARMLSHRWMVLLGASSFAFYLIHDPIIRICKGAFQHFKLTLADHWVGLVFGTALFVALQGLSIWTFQHVEMPIQKRLRSLIRKQAPTNCQPRAARA